MGFREIFSRKVAEQQEKAAVVAEEKRQAAMVRQGVPAEVEPKITALVAEVFEAMAEAGWPTIPVLGREESGLRAHALGSIGSYYSADTSCTAAVVVDSEGRIAFRHRVTATAQFRKAVSAEPLDYAYEQLLARMDRRDEPGGSMVYVTTSGDLMYSTSYLDAHDREVFTVTPLDEYLAHLAARTLEGSRPAV